MNMNPFNRAGEAVSEITRRSFLARSAAVTAASAAATPAVAEATVEPPVDLVYRLGAELSRALNEFADGQMLAEIYPSDSRSYAVGFKPFAAETQQAKVKRLVRELQYEMQKLPTVKTGAGAAHEVTFGSDAYLRIVRESYQGSMLVVGLIPPLPAGGAA
jgi:hypothetical protein